MIGDGGFVFSLEKRGYVKAGPWTPEAAIEHPDAGKLIQNNFRKILPLIPTIIRLKNVIFASLTISCFYEFGLQ